VPVFRNEVYLEIQGERAIVDAHDANDANDARAEVDEALLELADGSAE
jgi:hypothetical protein